MQAGYQLLVDDSHRRAVASWYRLQGAPEELTRVTAGWSIAWENGAGLRAVTYALILLLIGGGIEWLYWCYAGRARQAIAETVLAESVAAALPPRPDRDLRLRPVRAEHNWRVFWFQLAGCRAGSRFRLHLCGCGGTADRHRGPRAAGAELAAAAAAPAR